MPKPKQEDIDSPKIGKYNLRRGRKKKSLKKKGATNSDSDSSSDYDPEKDEMEDMNPRELQKFIQKIFPSKSGKERLKQLEKIDKLLKGKEKNTKISKRTSKRIKNKKVTAEDFMEETLTTEDEEEDSEDDEEIEVECEQCEDEGCENCEEAIVVDDGDFPENVDEELDASMKEMLGNNMKFNIIFTVGQPGNLYGNQYADERMKRMKMTKKKSILMMKMMKKKMTRRNCSKKKITR